MMSKKEKENREIELEAEIEFIDELIEEDEKKEKVEEFMKDPKVKKSFAEVALEFVGLQNVELWQCEGVAYMTVEIDGHYENFPVKSKKGRLYPARIFYDKMHKSLNKNALDLVLNELESRALFRGKEHQVFVRVGADQDGYIYHDLCNENWETIRIGANGFWLDSKPPIKFIRTDNMEALPYPDWPHLDLDHDTKQVMNFIDDILTDLFRITNLTRDTRGQVFLIAGLIGALRPTGPYPYIPVSGEKGSAKSSFGRIFGWFVDPRKVQLVRPPTKEQDVFVMAKNTWILAFDNASGIPPHIADAICSITTGGGFTARELYTDFEETTYNVNRLVMVNGIGNLTHRPDLLDRALPFHLKNIPSGERLTESQVLKIFNRIQPFVMTLLYLTVANGLRQQGKINLKSLPRMADFATWIYACLEDNDLFCEFTTPEIFLDYMESSISEVWDEILETDPFSKALLEYLDNNPKLKEVRTYDLWDGIIDAAGVDRYNIPDGLPRASKSLWSFVERAAPVIRDARGIDLQRTVKNKVMMVQINRPNSEPPEQKQETFDSAESNRSQIILTPESN